MCQLCRNSIEKLSEPDCPTVSTPEPKPKSEATSESDVTKIQKQPQPRHEKSNFKKPRQLPQKPSRKVRENATTAWNCGMLQRLSHSTAPTQPDSGLPIET